MTIWQQKMERAWGEFRTQTEGGRGGGGSLGSRWSIIQSSDQNLARKRDQRSTDWHQLIS